MTASGESHGLHLRRAVGAAVLVGILSVIGLLVRQAAVGVGLIIIILVAYGIVQLVKHGRGR